MTSSFPPSDRPREGTRELPPVDRPARADWLSDAPVTRALLALNVAVFLVEAALAGGVMNLPNRTALELGGSYAFGTVGEGRWETLVTACFLHDGLLHLGFNMMVLWQAGPLLERGIGSARMAPMYLFAGAFGNVASVTYRWVTRADVVSMGASGAICGIIAAALVVGWRVQGWKGPLTQAMARSLGIVIAFGIVSNLSAGRTDNAAHLGGAFAGGAIATLWRRGYRYSDTVTSWILAGCTGIVIASIGVVGFHDRTNRFASMKLRDRFEFTTNALADGRCRDAHDGLLAVESLRASMAPVSLRGQVERTCGHVDH